MPAGTAAVACAAALWCTPAPQGGTAAFARCLARPVALPFLWAGFRRSARDADLSGAVSRGRAIADLLPEWRDGHAYMAFLLAFEGTERATDPDQALDRLLAALALLERAGQRPDADARQRSSLLLTAAFLLEARTGLLPELAERHAARLGQPPLRAVADLIERAAAGHPDLDARVERAYVTGRLVGLALATGARDAAAATSARAVARLREVVPELRRDDRDVLADHAERYAGALESLGRWLTGDPDVSLERLRQDPMLEDLLSTTPR